MGESKESWWKKNLFLCLQKICFKDYNKPAQSVGYLRLWSLDINVFVKITPTFDQKQAGITGNTQEEENSAEKNNYDADQNAEANEIIDKNKDTIFTIEEL